jgi:hypothetical protein
VREDQSIQRDTLVQVGRIHQAYDRKIHWQVPDPKRPVAITFMADLHLGDTGTAVDQFEKDLDLILNTPNSYIIWGGDLIDNHIKHLSAMTHQAMPPSVQWAWLADILERSKDRTLAIIGGNHEAWTSALTGFDPLVWITDRLCLPYDSDEAVVEVQYPGQTYTVAIRHKYRYNSSANPSNSVKQWWTNGDANWDVGVICHLHTATIEPFVRHSKVRWAVRPGSYQVASQYAIREGFHGVAPVSPGVVLLPDRRGLHAYLTCEDTVDALTAKTSHYSGGSVHEKSKTAVFRARVRVRGRVCGRGRVRSRGESTVRTLSRENRGLPHRTKPRRPEGRTCQSKGRGGHQQDRPVRQNRK